MHAEHAIKTAFERSAQAMALRPGIGQRTAVTTVRVREGLTCEVEEGPWTLMVDMGEQHGGNDAGPNPGVLGRAALGSCLAMGYVRWAARLDVPLTHVEVEIQADYDARGEYGVADVPPGYDAVRYVVRIESDAPAAAVRRLIDIADAHTAFLDVFQRPIPVRREIHLLTPAE